MNTNTRVTYLRNDRGFPVGCVVMQYNKQTGYLEYQLTTHNPNDEFDRRQGRQLALGRLAEAPIELRIGKDPTMHQMAVTVMRDIATVGDAPARAVRAANSWLIKNAR